jgi:hypothetical protein
MGGREPPVAVLPFAILDAAAMSPGSSEPPRDRQFARSALFFTVERHLLRFATTY